MTDALPTSRLTHGEPMDAVRAVIPTEQHAAQHDFASAHGKGATAGDAASQVVLEVRHRAEQSLYFGREL